MYTRYFASCTISCEVNIHSPSSQHHNCLPPLPPSIPTQVIITHSRLYRRALTCGGSVSGLLPTLSPPPSPGPSRPCGAVAGLRPARRGDRNVAAPSPGLDRWRLRLRDPTDPASLSPPSSGSSRPGGAVARLRPVVAPSPGSYLPQPACMSERHRRQWAKSPPLLHVRRLRTAPTLVGKVTTLLHVRTAPTPMGHVNPQIPHSAQKN